MKIQLAMARGTIGITLALMLSLISNWALANDTAGVSFVRATDLMTLTQVVQLKLGKRSWAN